LFDAGSGLGGGGDDGIGTVPREEPRAVSATEQRRALTSKLMEEVCDDVNLDRALSRVVSNKGAAGVDGMRVTELKAWLDAHRDELRSQLLSGEYQPQPVKGVKIPKPGGGERQLGIPTVIDRLVQQAILQVLDPILDPTFSISSFGFRPGRSAHDALAQARSYVAEGRCIVVDLDLEKFFDHVNHDILMNRLGRHVGDKRVLRVIGRFLRAGLMQDGVRVGREEGTPQGGPLSPLLANLLLDDLDKELEQRGHCFCRYADDCNIYVRTPKAGERVMASVTAFLVKRLKLKVNREKSSVGPVWERKFLGHRLLSNGGLGIAPKSLERFKDRVREITRRNRGVSLSMVVNELNRYLLGWGAYYRYISGPGALDKLDGWVRRKVRCYRLKQCKRARGIASFLMSRGVSRDRAYCLGGSGKGWWRLSFSPQSSKAMDKNWFELIGLVSLFSRYRELKR
jgi:RNA-directed DNA polymerase